MPAAVEQPSWSRDLAAAIRDPAILLRELGLSPSESVAADVAGFPLLVPRSYVARMEFGNPQDPLLKQVLPISAEQQDVPGFTVDAVGDDASRVVPGVLHKYEGRALLITTGACAVHCRYCFRRHYAYGDEPKRLDDWQPALDYLAAAEDVTEVLLSGGDPLMLTDRRLGELIDRLEAIPHLKRLRIHTRLPIVLPSRVTEPLLTRLTEGRLQPVVVVHANHPRELVNDCADALLELTRRRILTLNQTVLLRGVNDDADTLVALSERLLELGVLPYYLHQLDRVQGTAHFEVSEERGRELMTELRRRLPGYAVPRYVREVAGAESKVPID